MARYTKRGKVWQYEISYKSQDGKYKKIRKSGFPKKSDAIFAASEIETKIGKGFAVHDKDILLSDYFRQWMDVYKKGKVSNVTYLKYETTAKNIEKYFKSESIKSLNRTKYQHIINRFAKTHATETVENLNAYIRASIVNLIDEKIIPFDFTKNAVTKGDNATKSEKDKFLNYTEFVNLMTLVKKNINPRFSSPLMILVAGMTGMRFAELLGLTWDAINYEENYIEVYKTWDYMLKSGFSTTKNEQSNRKISVDSNTLEILKKFHSSQQTLLSNLSVKNKDNLVFYNVLNGVISNNAANKQLSTLCQKIGSETTITLHGLRHTHASILLYKGVDVMMVSKRLGHKNIGITLSVYSHILKELEEKENSKITAILKQV